MNRIVKGRSNTKRDKTQAREASQDPNSPYSQMMQNVAKGFDHILEGGSSAVIYPGPHLNQVH